ncbi:MAG: hypothetical protein EOM51_10450 [Clostridia bacterium]|nr:hypothetical protein [Clostridia bacterium]
MVTRSVLSMSKRRERGKRVLRLLLVLGIAVTALIVGGRSEVFANPADRPFQLAMTSSVFTNVNENDIRAALKVWVRTLAEKHGIQADPNPKVYRTVEDLMQFARTTPIDALGITTPEYVIASKEMAFDLFGTGATGGRIEVVYLLLVNQDSGIQRLDQLAGRSMNVLLNPRLSMAEIWLDTLLLEAKLKRTSDFLKKVTKENKVSQVVLPVFFGAVDACLVTQDSFEVMCDLNPQLKKKLRILSSSPPLVPAGFAFLRDSASPYRQQVIEVLATLQESPAGKQILELTQSETIKVHSISCLDKSLELLKKHRRLLGNS